MHGSLARVSIHAWLDGAHTSMRARPKPCMARSRASPSMHGSTAHVHPCIGMRTLWASWVRSSHAWLAHTRLHPYMAGRRTCIDATPPPSHAWLAHTRLHPCMAGRRTCIDATPPPHPCMACSRASPSMHGSTAHVHQCEPTTSHAWLAHTRLHPCMAGRHTCINASPSPSHAWPARARLHPYMAGRRLCISVRPPLAMHA